MKLDMRLMLSPKKARNGVAVIYKNNFDYKAVSKKLHGINEDESARFIEFEINGIRMINIYAPNGNPYPGEKFDYKLEWLECLYARLKTLRDERQEFILGGDMNIIPEDKDCYNPKAWENDALFHIESRKLLRRIYNLGIYDAFRIFNNNSEQYSFWDYQAGAFRNNHGIRIDYFLCSPAMVDKLHFCYIDTQPRTLPHPSDHTPIIAEFQNI